MLLCDRCDAGCHIDCLRPALATVPAGAWFCPCCSPPTPALPLAPAPPPPPGGLLRLAHADVGVLFDGAPPGFGVAHAPKFAPQYARVCLAHESVAGWYCVHLCQPRGDPVAAARPHWRHLPAASHGVTWLLLRGPTQLPALPRLGPLDLPPPPRAVRSPPLRGRVRPRDDSAPEPPSGARRSARVRARHRAPAPAAPSPSPVVPPFRPTPAVPTPAEPPPSASAAPDSCSLHVAPSPAVPPSPPPRLPPPPRPPPSRRLGLRLGPFLGKRPAWRRVFRPGRRLARRRWVVSPRAKKHRAARLPPARPAPRGPRLLLRLGKRPWSSLDGFPPVLAARARLRLSLPAEGLPGPPCVPTNPALFGDHPE